MTRRPEPGAPERVLAEFAATTDHAALPRDVVAAVKRLLIWTTGTTVAGSQAPGSAHIAAVARAAGGRGSTILGRGGTSAPSAAGMANGAFAKALEYEDKLWVDPTHGFCVSAAVVPAALAVAEARGAVSGADLIAAVAVGIEVQSRLVLAVPDAIDDHRWNPSYLHASLGAAAASARVMGAGTRQFLDALGIAYVQAAGNRQATVESADAVRLQLGFAVRNGIVAAELAAGELTGPRQLLTGEFGLFPLYWSDREVNLDTLTRDLGRDYKLTGIGLKAHPCGAVAHAALDALGCLVASERPDPDRIVRIEVEGSERLWYMVHASRARAVPSTPVELRFSLPWAIACTAVDGRLTLRHFTEDAAADSRYRRIATSVSAAGTSQDGASAVSVVMDDGRSLHSPRVGIPLGHPSSPLSEGRVHAVFSECLEYGLGARGARVAADALAMLDELESVPDVGRLARLLT